MKTIKILTYLMIVSVMVGCNNTNTLQNENQQNPIGEANETNQNVTKDYTLSIDGYSFEMVFVRGGTFTMGCTDEQGSDCDDDEKPAHQVSLNDYWIGKYEVTQGLWRRVMGSNPSEFKGCGDDCPVEDVSWEDCQEFIMKLNELTGKKFRIPTEAEWEYAARGGVSASSTTGQTKYAGSNDLEVVGWYWEENNDVRYSGGYEQDGRKRGTHAVGTKKPNALGIYDMSGNVWEWCNDWYGDYGGGSQNNPTGPSSGSLRLVRGGCWADDALRCRVVYRYGYYPSDWFNSYGLRLVSSSY